MFIQSEHYDDLREDNIVEKIYSFMAKYSKYFNGDPKRVKVKFLQDYEELDGDVYVGTACFKKGKDYTLDDVLAGCFGVNTRYDSNLLFNIFWVVPKGYDQHGSNNSIEVKSFWYKDGTITFNLADFVHSSENIPFKDIKKKTTSAKTIKSKIKKTKTTKPKKEAVVAG